MSACEMTIHSIWLSENERDMQFDEWGGGRSKVWIWMDMGEGPLGSVWMPWECAPSRNKNGRQVWTSRYYRSVRCKMKEIKKKCEWYTDDIACLLELHYITNDWMLNAMEKWKDVHIYNIKAVNHHASRISKLGKRVGNGCSKWKAQAILLKIRTIPK